MAETQSTSSTRPPMTARPELSIVIPIFDEPVVVDDLHRRLAASLSTIATWEVVFVDDGSPSSRGCRRELSG